MYLRSLKPIFRSIVKINPIVSADFVVFEFCTGIKIRYFRMYAVIKETITRCTGKKVVKGWMGNYRMLYVIVTDAVTVTSPGWMGVGTAADFIAAPLSY